MKRFINLKILSLLAGLLFFQIHLIFAHEGYADLPKITWISPSKEYTILKSSKATIRATVKSASGVTSVLLYLNDVLYGEPEMNPSQTDIGAFILNKNINFEPGENSIYIVVTSSEGFTTSEKRYFRVDVSSKIADTTGSLLTTGPRVAWTRPLNIRTVLSSAKADIRATVESNSGIKSVVLYLNDVLYGEPEMSPSQTKIGTFILGKTVYLEPGENSVYLVVTSSEGSVTSEKRYFTVDVSSRIADATDSSITTGPRIVWARPSNIKTTLSAPKADIKATVESIAGISSVVLYLNDVLYGEPDMSPSQTKIGTFILDKTVYFEPGENSIYLVVTSSDGSTISGKRYFMVDVSSKIADTTTLSLPEGPKIVWTRPSNIKTNLNSPKADIKAIIESFSGISSVTLFLNDSLYGEPEMSPSITAKESFIVSKTVNFKPGENSLYIVVTSSEGSIQSEKRYFSVEASLKALNPVVINLPPAPSLIWTTPAVKNTTLKSSSANFTATIRSASALISAVWYLNGVSQGETEIKPLQNETGSYIIEKTLHFKQVENNIYFEASNAGGTTRSEPRYLICPPSTLVAKQSSNQVTPKTGNVNPPDLQATRETVASKQATPEKAAPITASSAKDGPIITWTSPSGTHTTLESFNAIVKASIKSNSGLKSVLIYVNGISKGETEVRPLAESSGSYLMEKNLSFGPGENNIYVVATNNEGTTKSELRYFSNPSAVKPVIIWSNPVATNSLVNIGNFIVSACIKSPIELRSVKLIVNGNLQFEDAVFQASDDDDCNYNWEGSVVLKEGDNSIYMIATNIAGSTTSEQRVIKLASAITEKRLALVFGNSLYENKTPLKNPVNDANLMEGTLKDLGFEVIKRLNASRDEMMTAIREFNEKLSDYSVALFYYAGHGHQVDGKNYLIPTDAILEKPGDCKYEAIEVNFIVEEFEQYQDNTNIVILDACRSNPFASWVRGGEAGFRSMNFTSGTIIGFATSENATAADGKGDNGLYTQELVKQMNIHQPINSVFNNTRVQVRKLSNNQQIPTEENKLNGEFYFRK